MASRLVKLVAVWRVVDATVRLRATWRGHPDSPWSLYGLLGDPGQPWRMPSALYRVPFVPIRIYLRVGDAILFRLWYAIVKPALDHMTAVADPTYVDDAIRRKVNADLALADELGIAPDGGSFDAGARLDRLLAPPAAVPLGVSLAGDRRAGIRPRSDAARGAE